MDVELAVFVPMLGVANHHYVYRHINDLLPGKTIVIAGQKTELGQEFWRTKCRSLILTDLHKRRGFRTTAQIMRLVLNHNLTKTVIKSYLMRHQVKKIMGEFMDWSLPWLEISRDLNIPFFVHAHGKDVSANLKNPFWQTEYLLYKRSAGIITINQISKLRLIELGFDQEFIHVIPCGVDVPELLLEKECKETVHCLAVGRMTAKKGPILTLDAFRRALEAYPNLELDYIGEGELYPAAEQYVKAFNIADKVTFHPLQPHNIVCEYMKRADIFLQHSIVNPIDGDEEGLPVAILEAMSYGVPVVSTRHAGIPEAVVDGVTGYLVAEGDSVDMGNKISSLALNRNQRVVMGRNSWIRAKDYFSWESERAKLLRVLGIQVEDLISPNAGTSFANAQPSTISS